MCGNWLLVAYVFATINEFLRFQQKEEISQALRAEQAVLADRGAAIMCLMYLSASNGEPSDMVAEALQLGIHLLNGGNSKIQEVPALMFQIVLENHSI